MIPEVSTWNFADLCLYVYCIVDDLLIALHKRLPALKRPGPAPECSDSELLAMCLIGECMSWDEESVLLGRLREHRTLFPRQPTQSRFNRRRRRLGPLTNLVRQALLQTMELAHDRQCILDSLPVPVVQFHLAPNTLAAGAGAHWKAHGATFGKVASRKQTFFGYKLQLLITGGGLILDFLLAPASAMDLDAGQELLSGHAHLAVAADKGYISAFVAHELWQFQRIRLLTVPRRNQRKQLPPAVAALYKGFRQLVETVISQLNGQFHIETNHAHTFGGLCARLYTKLTAHTLCIFINRLREQPDWLHIKPLTMPQLA
jgi:hypothetical protein